MEKKSIIPQEIFSNEEEKTLVWENVQSSFEKNFGAEVYSSWLKNISLLKEYRKSEPPSCRMTPETRFRAGF